MTAYEEGQEAYRDGDSPSMNPFDYLDPQRNEWDEGYRDERLKEE